MIIDFQRAYVIKQYSNDDFDLNPSKMIDVSPFIWKGQLKTVAISHVWGHQGKIVDGIEPSRDVLGGRCAERFFYKRDLTAKVLNIQPELIWMDALDVEQFDTKKKEDDVKLMQTVYKGVDRTIVVMEGEPPKLEELFSKVISSEWYKRSWVYQEIMLSKDLCFLHDNGIISFNELMINEIKKSIECNNITILFDIIRHLIATRASGSNREHLIFELSLNEVYSIAKNYEAYYEQDRLVAIGNAHDLGLHIDYSSRLTIVEYMHNCATKYDIDKYILPYAGVPCIIGNSAENRSCIPMTWEFCTSVVAKNLNPEDPPIMTTNGILLTLYKIDLNNCEIFGSFKFNDKQSDERIKNIYIEQLTILPDMRTMIENLQHVDNKNKNESMIVKYQHDQGLILFWNVVDAKLDIENNWYIRSQGLRHGNKLGGQTISFLVQISPINKKNIVTGYGVSFRKPWKLHHKPDICKILVN